MSASSYYSFRSMLHQQMAMIFNILATLVFPTIMWTIDTLQWGERQPYHTSILPGKAWVQELLHQYFAIPPGVHMDSTGLYPKNGLHWTGVQSSPLFFFFPLFFKAEFENCNTLLIMVMLYIILQHFQSWVWKIQYFTDQDTRYRYSGTLQD